MLEGCTLPRLLPDVKRPFSKTLLGAYESASRREQFTGGSAAPALPEDEALGGGRERGGSLRQEDVIARSITQGSPRGRAVPAEMVPASTTSA